MGSRHTRVVALLGLVAFLDGCASPSVASPTAATPSVAPSSASAAIRTFPPSQTPIEPGTYGWTGFEPRISFVVGPGWELGHDRPEFFDLFRGSDFPSVSFGRFTDVYTDASGRVAATDAKTIVMKMRGRSDVTLSGVGDLELAGLNGQQFVLATTRPQTPLFRGPAGDFKMDPEFENRYRLLDLPAGGVLFVGVHGRKGGLDAADDLAEPILTSLAFER